MKNYYKILQVDKDASPEIIKVAYKLLVKKNHPDLKEGEEKQIAEERIKEINEAYDVLSDPSRKSEYDLNLIKDFISQEQYNEILNENINLKKELDYFNHLYNKNNYAKRPYSNMYNNTWAKKYTQANNTYSKQNNYNTNNNNAQNSYNNQHTNNNKINNFKTNLNEKLKTFIALILTFLIIFAILNIPFIKEYWFNYLDSGYLVFFVAIIVFYIYFFKNKQ